MDAPADNADDAASRKTLGQTLAVERERQGLSRADAAQRLHMSAWQIEALETGDFARLPKGTFLRGFVRNYAKVLGLAPESVMPLLVEDAPAAGRPGIVVPTQNIRFEPLHERLQSPYVKAATIAVVVIAVALAGMYWWVFIRPAPPATTHKPTPAAPATKAKPSPAPDVVSTAPVMPPVALPETAPAVAPAPASPVQAQAVSKGAPSTPAKSAPANATPAPPAVPVSPAKAAAANPTSSEPVVVGEGSGRLKFRFRGESWVEIRDARGRLILSRLNAAGSEAEVRGQPPFNVIVGNAPEVELSYNDRTVDLESHTKVAVARLTVE